MEHDIKIAPLTEEDLPFLNETRNECREFLHDNDHYKEADTLVWFRMQEPEFYLLSLDDTRIGYVRTSNRINTDIYIGIDINIKFRGKGLARLCYEKAIAFLKTTGITDFYLEVLETNTRAIHIYEDLGFVLQKKTYTIVRNNQHVDSLLYKL
jgi:ribosomal protein S18 acetylase RimI-like enzyme